MGVLEGCEVGCSLGCREGCAVGMREGRVVGCEVGAIASCTCICVCKNLAMLVVYVFASDLVAATPTLSRRGWGEGCGGGGGGGGGAAVVVDVAMNMHNPPRAAMTSTNTKRGPPPPFSPRFVFPGCRRGWPSSRLSIGAAAARGEQPAFGRFGVGGVLTNASKN